MGVALDLYQALNEAPDDKTRAKLIAEAIEAVEERYPHLPDLATQAHLRDSELRLLKEIKEVEAKLQKDIKEVEAKLQKDIKNLDVKIHEVEARLLKEIQAQKLEIKEVELRLEKEIRSVEGNLLRAMNAQTRWMLGGFAVLGVVFKLADVLIK